MAPAKNVDENFNFVLLCLNSATSNNGKIDYGPIAKAFAITPHSAYMRLWNFKKKAGLISSGTNDTTSDPSMPNTKKRGRPPGQASKAKKQKGPVAAVVKSVDDEEDELEEEPEHDGEEFESESESKQVVKVEETAE